MAAFKFKDFEAVTADAFSFLLKNHAYAACAAEPGGHLGSGFLRRFVRGSHEIGVCFGDADSHHLCRISFRDDVGQNIVERSYMVRELGALLAQRCPSFAHPTRAELSDALTPEAIVRQYAELLQRYAIDVVEGDFSAFPLLMYVLHHVDHERSVRRFLGIYSTYERVRASIDDRRLKRGFAERANGFEIWRVQVDGYGFWFAGIPLDSSRENHG